MKPSPLVIVEEHHEAFLLWHYAIRQGDLPPAGNFLLHVDAHDDLRSPALRCALPSLTDPLDEVYRFTYEQLRIASFILPAVYQGLFSDVCWWRPGPTAQEVHRRNYVRSITEEGRSFVIGPDPSPWPHGKPWQDRVPFSYTITSGPDGSLRGLPVVLDIDLDFFACQPGDRREVTVEVVREEYDRFMGTRYHPLRLSHSSYAEEKDGRYYLTLGRAPIVAAAPPTRETLAERVAAFVRALVEARVRPVFIEVCRSVHSGFVHPEAAAIAEELVVRGLGEVYRVEVTSLHRLFSGPGFESSRQTAPTATAS